jgi:hypothetical protein
MTDPPQHARASDEPVGGGADPTRDIRLPSLPDRPPSILPSQWASAQPPAEKARPVPTSLVDQPTDTLGPPGGRPRECTIAFASPEMATGRPASTVGPTRRRPRRWPWVVLTLVPILVILGAGLTLVLLLRGA